jgi:hypothetical protein
MSGLNSKSANFLSHALLCPKTLDKIKLSDFPVTLNIPWIFKNPELQISEWNQKLKSVIDFYGAQALRAEDELRQVHLSDATKDRLEQLKSAYLKASEVFEEYLSPLKNTEEKTSPFEHIFFEKVPRQQTVMAYHQTLFRDWVWGQNEIDKQLRVLKPYLNDTRNLLVLGAGSCGLPLTLHRSLTSLSNTLAVDINPVLFFTVQKLHSQNFSVIEFPNQPLNLKDVSLSHEISSVAIPDNFHLIFADAQSLEFQTDVFDTLLTPWFIDIVPRPFTELARHLNQSLKKGGRWLNLGPLGFEKNRLSEIVSSDEVKVILEDAGFKIEIMQNVPLPYMKSPYSRISREDQVLFFSAIKIHAAKKPGRFDYLPNWLRDLNAPIPVQPEIQNLNIKTQIFSKALELVDGQKGVSQISKIFAHQFKMDEKSAQDSLHQFFVNVWEQLVLRDF